MLTRRTGGEVFFNPELVATITANHDATGAVVTMRNGDEWAVSEDPKVAAKKIDAARIDNEKEMTR
jgi:uncharacterized protein YlzI (FlbEa/FlbD family)